MSDGDVLRALQGRAALVDCLPRRRRSLTSRATLLPLSLQQTGVGGGEGARVAPPGHAPGVQRDPAVRSASAAPPGTQQRRQQACGRARAGDVGAAPVGTSQPGPCRAEPWPPHLPACKASAACPACRDRRSRSRERPRRRSRSRSRERERRRSRSRGWRRGSHSRSRDRRRRRSSSRSRSRERGRYRSRSHERRRRRSGGRDGQERSPGRWQHGEAGSMHAPRPCQHRLVLFKTCRVPGSPARLPPCTPAASVVPLPTSFACRAAAICTPACCLPPADRFHSYGSAQPSARMRGYAAALSGAPAGSRRRPPLGAQALFSSSPSSQRIPALPLTSLLAAVVVLPPLCWERLPSAISFAPCLLLSSWHGR